VAGVVQTDEHRLKQILASLLINAVALAPEDGTVGLEVMGDAKQDAVHFTVWDTGVGLAEEELERLFEPFAGSKDGQSHRYEDVGLGLTLVRYLADRLGGGVSAQSKAGEGSRFTVSRTVEGERGRLVNTTLLPEIDNLEIEAIGGPGKEFWVFGENYPNSPRGDREGSHELGAWRMQLSPKAPAELDCFLNVMQVMDRESGSPHPAHLVEGEAVVGIQVADRAVLFSRSGQRLDEPVSFDLSGEGALKVLVTDLAEGTWQIWRDGEIIAPAVEVSADGGVLYLEGPAGSYALRR